MVNLYDIARQAGGGAWFDAASRQFGLPPTEMQRAVEALLPAFTLAFQRAAMNPANFAELLGMVGSGRFAPFYDAAALGRPQADSVLPQLFGSRQAADAVAAQASAMTGIGVQVMQQMLPVLAATLIGGMFRYATLEGFADLLRQWSDAIKAAHPPPKPAPTDPWSAWADAMGRLLGGAPQRAQPQPAAASFADLMNAMLGGTAKPSPPPPPSAPDPFAAMVRMFDTGREVQAQHLASFRSVLDSAWGAPPSR